MLTQWNTRAQNRKFVASYRGGKDSSLALYQAMQMGKPVALIVMLEEQGLKSRSHGMSLDIIHAQAKAIGFPSTVPLQRGKTMRTSSFNCYKKLKV